jgi:hypothetical protein
MVIAKIQLSFEPLIIILPCSVVALQGQQFSIAFFKNTTLQWRIELNRHYLTAKRG